MLDNPHAMVNIEQISGIVLKKRCFSSNVQILQKGRIFKGV